jgi:hypothetical protein
VDEENVAFFALKTLFVNELLVQLGYQGDVPSGLERMNREAFLLHVPHT